MGMEEFATKEVVEVFGFRNGKPVPIGKPIKLTYVHRKASQAVSRNREIPMRIHRLTGRIAPEPTKAEVELLLHNNGMRIIMLDGETIDIPAKVIKFAPGREDVFVGFGW